MRYEVSGCEFASFLSVGEPVTFSECSFHLESTRRRLASSYLPSVMRSLRNAATLLTIQSTMRRFWLIPEVNTIGIISSSTA